MANIEPLMNEIEQKRKKRMAITQMAFANVQQCNADKKKGRERTLTTSNT